MISFTLAPLKESPENGKKHPLQVPSDPDDGWAYLSIYDKDLQHAQDPANKWLKGEDNESMRIACYSKPMCTQDAVYITISEDDQISQSVHCEPLEPDTVRDRKYMLFSLEQTDGDRQFGDVNMQIKSRGYQNKAHGEGSHNRLLLPSRAKVSPSHGDCETSQQEGWTEAAKCGEGDHSEEQISGNSSTQC